MRVLLVEAAYIMTKLATSVPDAEIDPHAASGTDRRGEAGVGVVEMLVAAFILSLGVVGVASLFIASARLGSVAAVERDAFAVASSELEIVRSASYESIGIATTASGYQSRVDGLPTVTEDGTNIVEPRGAVTIDGTDFGITRSVVWAQVGGDASAYKIVTVTVEWQTPSGERSIDLQTGIHEGLTDA